jgi:penicillin-binding protein 1A
MSVLQYVLLATLANTQSLGRMPPIGASSYDSGGWRYARLSLVLNFIRQMFRGFSLVTLCVLTIPAAVFVCIVGGFIFLPLPVNLPTPNSTLPSQPTMIYDVNGQQIAELRQFDQNIPVQQSDIPLVMKQATVASEDKHFYEHKGIDVPGTLRALEADLRSGKTVQGGSTITQQYVKLAYTNRQRTVSRKVKEAILASALDRQVNKDEILYRYLQAVYFGDGSYGIGAAAQSYFHIPVNQLNASQAATLVGVIPSPTAWAPRENLSQAEARRQEVLGKMLQQHYIDQAQYQNAIAHPLWLESQGTPPGPVTMIYNLQQNTNEQYPYFVDYVTRYLELKYGPDATYRGGLRVQTTLDPTLQTEAEADVADTLKGTSSKLDMAIVSVEPQTGFVRALVGGRDYSTDKVNLALGSCPAKPSAGTKVEVDPTCWKTPNVTGGGSGRQPGSSFKPFVLASAYEEGISPTKVYSDPSVFVVPNCRATKGSDCTIHNDEGESRGPINIKDALAYSLNTVYVPLIRDTGISNTANMAKKLGVDDAYYSSSIHGTSGNYALGTISVAPIEMASAYGVFANGGERQPATPIVKIINSTGKTLEDNSNRQPTRVISQAVADNVTAAMEGVIDHGTAAATANIGRPAAGKTGTTDSYGDAWFVGYTPSLSTAVWMGDANDNQTINYRGDHSVYGGTIPASAWATYMKQALQNVPPTDFNQPAPITKVNSSVLGSVSTLPPVISPQTKRSPLTTPTPSQNQVNTGAPYVPAPPSVTTTIPPPPTVPPTVATFSTTTQPTRTTQTTSRGGH